MNKLNENRSLLFIIFYYIYSGIYFVIHMMDAKNPFMTSTLDGALVIIGIFLCFAGLFRISEPRIFLIKGLKCFAFCDVFSLFLQYLYGKDVSLFFIWMNIILKVFIAIALIRRILDYLAEIYWKNGAKNKSVKFKIRKLRLGIIFLISPVIINYLYVADLRHRNFNIIYGYIFICYLLGLVQYILLLRESMSGYVNSLSPEEEPYARKWFFYWEWDRYNPISMIDRVLSAFAEILFGDKKRETIIISVSATLMLLTVICNGIYVGGKYRIDNPPTEELSKISSSQAINADPCIDCPEVENGSLKVYRYSKDNLTPVNSKIHKVKYGIATDDGVNTGAKYPVKISFEKGLTEDGFGHIIDYHGNVVLTLPKIALSRISAKTKFYREVFAKERRQISFDKIDGTDRAVVLGENGSKRLLADNGSAIFYSEVLGSYGMCDKNGKIIVKPEQIDYIRARLETEKICMFRKDDGAYIYNYDGKDITGKILESYYSGLEFIKNDRELDCVIYCYDNTKTGTEGKNAHDYLRVVDYEGNIIADNIIYCRMIDSNKYLLTMEDNRQYILTGSDGKPVIIEEEGGFLSDDETINEKLMQDVRIRRGEKVESAAWVDEDHSLYRVSIERTEEVEGEYAHLRDYFFLKNNEKTISFMVDYPSKSDYMYSERYVFDACDFNAAYVDVNFDGHKDVVISLGHQGVAGEEVHCAYIYDNNGEFVYTKSFEIVPNYFIDEEENVLKGSYGSGPGEHVELTYKYENGEFAKISEEKKPN